MVATCRLKRHWRWACRGKDYVGQCIRFEAPPLRHATSHAAGINTGVIPIVPRYPSLTGSYQEAWMITDGVMRSPSMSLWYFLLMLFSNISIYKPGVLASMLL
jgi:hypothetical protein